MIPTLLSWRKKSGVSVSQFQTPHLRSKVFAFHELLWALIGLILTIGATLIEAFTTTPPWTWVEQGLKVQSLGVTYQIGAVLLTGCLGGKNAGVISQIAYVSLGLTWLPVFSRGGGIGYLGEPTFGYLLGFIFGAWICGYFAFKARPRLELLAFSCLCGLLVIHLCGIIYLILQHLLTERSDTLFQAILQYSVYLLPGQLAIACAVTLIAFLVRRLMFY